MKIWRVGLRDGVPGGCNFVSQRELVEREASLVPYGMPGGSFNIMGCARGRYGLTLEKGDLLFRELWFHSLFH
jgi:hypothetical protein